MKLNLYDKQRVREYWFVSLAVPFVMIYHLEGGQNGKPEYLKTDGNLCSRVLFGLSVPVSDIISGTDSAAYSLKNSPGRYQSLSDSGRVL